MCIRDRARIREGLAQYMPGTTKIIIAQRISSVQDADRILVLDGGRINGDVYKRQMHHLMRISILDYNTEEPNVNDRIKGNGCSSFRALV